VVASDRLMGSFRRLSEFVGRHPGLAVAAFAGLYGLQTNGEAEFRTISAAPFVVNLPAQDQYLYGSPFTFLLGSYYQHHGLDYAWAFFTVNALGLAAFFSSLYALMVRQFQSESRGAAALVFFSSPLLFVLLSWIGKSDAYLLAFYFLFRLTGSGFTQLLLCALMTVCHRELAVVVLLVHLCLDPGRWRPAALGLLAGEAAVYLYTHALLSSVPASRAGFVVDHAAELWRKFRS
jgi:hypothetical protein